MRVPPRLSPSLVSQTSVPTKKARSPISLQPASQPKQQRASQPPNRFDPALSASKPQWGTSPKAKSKRDNKTRRPAPKPTPSYTRPKQPSVSNPIGEPTPSHARPKKSGGVICRSGSGELRLVFKGQNVSGNMAPVSGQRRIRSLDSAKGLARAIAQAERAFQPTSQRGHVSSAWASAPHPPPQPFRSLVGSPSLAKESHQAASTKAADLSVLEKEPGPTCAPADRCGTPKMIRGAALLIQMTLLSGNATPRESPAFPCELAELAPCSQLLRGKLDENRCELDLSGLAQGLVAWAAPEI